MQNGIGLSPYGVTAMTAKCPWLPSGQGIGSRLACHVFEPSIRPKDPPCRGAMHVKSVESSNVLLWCGS
ncbi:hypothetical protein TNCV_549481 [Trichonephila clavipes]|nr:hypothetical protein TNCV_549481 [Trichonephila clavipes]